MADRIDQTLRAALNPSSLIVIDESHLHAGHSHAPAGGESHFRIEITGVVFRRKSRLERQRMVYDALRAELRAGIHALSISASDVPEAG